MTEKSKLSRCKRRHGVITTFLRRVSGLQQGTRLIARQDGDRTDLARREAAERRLKARVAHVPKDVSLVDELLADRRIETAGK